APRPDRGRRHSPGRVADRRQPPRRHRTAPADPQDPAGTRPPRSAPPPPRPTVRRPRLRPRQVPPGRAGQGHPTVHRPPWPAPRLRTRCVPVGGRAHDRLVPRHATATHPVGTPRRHPRSLPRSGHLHHHVPTRRTTLLGTLSRVRPALPQGTP